MDICLTHLHCDHVGSLGSLILYCYYILKIKPRLILPDNDDYRNAIESMLMAMGCATEKYCVAIPDEIREYSAFRKMYYVSTRHQLDQQAFSIVFETSAGGVFYSGDTCTTDQLRVFLATHHEPECIYMDTTDTDFPGNVHLSLKLLEEAVPLPIRSRVKMMHINRAECIKNGHMKGFGVV